MPFSGFTAEEAAPGEREEPRAPLLEVKDLALLRQGRRILSQISFSLDEGGCLALLGPSGCGKSSLLRAVAGLDPVDEGLVLLDGRVRNAPGRASLGRGEIGMVFQGEQLYSHMTLLDNLALAPVRVLGLRRQDALAEAAALLEAVGLAGKGTSYPAQLSGGQRQRAAIVRALALKPRLMLFDEPTSSLDPSCVQEVLSLILSLRGKGQAMIVVTHHAGFARGVADRILVMDQGRLVSEERPEAVVAQPAGPLTQELFAGGMDAVSALDRARVLGCLRVALPEGCEAEARQFQELARLAGSLGCRLAFLSAPRDAFALWLRLGLCELCLARDEGRACQGEASIKLLAGGWRVLAREADMLWYRWLGRVLA
ncbi:MAG: amino acid ABC transporter ATP-binding protein [Desulfovibrio sp.]|nr:amino acid ABC transporter ATP-binding protein [Desulfovibrio sp.]